MKYPRVVCPGCKKPMRPSNPRPSRNKELVDVSYRCEKCGADTIGTMKLEVPRENALARANNAAHYRILAQRCCEIASNCKQNDRIALELMAEEWLKIAAEHEGRSKSN